MDIKRLALTDAEMPMGLYEEAYEWVNKDMRTVAAAQLAKTLWDVRDWLYEDPCTFCDKFTIFEDILVEAGIERPKA